MCPARSWSTLAGSTSNPKTGKAGAVERGEQGQADVYPQADDADDGRPVGNAGRPTGPAAAGAGGVMSWGSTRGPPPVGKRRPATAGPSGRPPRFRPLAAAWRRRYHVGPGLTRHTAAVDARPTVGVADLPVTARPLEPLCPPVTPPVLRPPPPAAVPVTRGSLPPPVPRGDRAGRGAGADVGRGRGQQLERRRACCRSPPPTAGAAIVSDTLFGVPAGRAASSSARCSSPRTPAATTRSTRRWSAG